MNGEEVYRLYSKAAYAVIGARIDSWDTRPRRVKAVWDELASELNLQREEAITDAMRIVQGRRP